MGLLKNIVVGILGAMIGGFVVGFFGGTGVTGFNLWSIFVAFLGAVILLAIINLFTK
ncbi:MAG TPA: GlsB/YeaQ/YmgE family stress response membrane protein [Acetobacterium sp.]